METIGDEKHPDTLQSDLVGKSESDTDAIQWTEEEEKRLLRKSVFLLSELKHNILTISKGRSYHLAPPDLGFLCPAARQRKHVSIAFNNPSYQY